MPLTIVRQDPEPVEQLPIKELKLTCSVDGDSDKLSVMRDSSTALYIRADRKRYDRREMVSLLVNHDDALEFAQAIIDFVEEQRAR